MSNVMETGHCEHCGQDLCDPNGFAHSDLRDCLRVKNAEIERLWAEHLADIERLTLLTTGLREQTARLGNSEGMLASLCDRMNTWARELGTEESTKWKDLGQMAQLLDRVVFAAKATLTKFESESE